MNRLIGGLLGTVVLLANPALAQVTNGVAEPKDAAYLRTLHERAAKITAALGLANPAKSNRVHCLVVEQYRGLNDIHFVREVAVGAAKAKFAGDQAAADAATQVARDNAKLKLAHLHGEFLAKLAAELSPEQIEQVKDGMTYGVLPLTYGVYLKMYPDLTAEQKAQIKTWLTEARELAMDGSTSDEKHALFGKYKGRINNYLVKAGYDLKQGEKNLRKADARPRNPQPK